MKRFEQPLLGSELKKQTDNAEGQYQQINDDIKKLAIKDDKEPTIKKYERLNLICNRDFIFYKFYDINKFHQSSFL